MGNKPSKAIQGHLTILCVSNFIFKRYYLLICISKNRKANNITLQLAKI